MMLRLEALRSRALPLLLNAADRLMSGKKRSDVDSDQRILCLHLSFGRSWPQHQFSLVTAG